MSKFTDKLQAFMQGRNGNDQLNIFIMILYLLLFLVNTFTSLWYLALVEFVLVIYWFFRFYSRNIPKRRRENDRFVRFYSKIIYWFRTTFRKKQNKTKKAKPIKTVKQQKEKKAKPIKPEKNHVFVTCPICSQTMQVRDIKGERYILCKSCHNEVKIKIGK